MSTEKKTETVKETENTEKLGLVIRLSKKYWKHSLGKWRIKLSGRYIYARFASPRRVVQGLSFLLGISPQIQKRKGDKK